MSQSQNKFHLLFKEQWWCISTLTSLQGEKLSEKISAMAKFGQEQLDNYSLTDINPGFVPDERDRKNIINLSKELQIDSLWKEYQKDFNYEENNKVFTTIGYILFRVRMKKGSSFKIEDIRPSYMQQIIFRVWNGIAKKFKEDFKFDDATPPYAFSICSSYSPNQPYIPWIQENRSKYKQEIGTWIEIYSGSFDDYRDELYNSRIEVDVSNRNSEMHYINKNSGLIYMDPANYDSYFMKSEETPKSTGYIFDVLMATTIRVRTILFIMLIINNRIDEDTKNLANDKYNDQDPKKIKEDLEKTTRLKNILQLMLAPFFTDLTRSHRQHYTATLQRAVEIYKINENWEMIQKKIEANINQLNALFMTKQDEAAETQEGLLNTVNYILGGSILFEIANILLEGSEYATPISKTLGAIFLALLIFIVIRFIRAKKKAKKEGVE